MAEVRRTLKVATIASELRSRRVKWLQQIGQHPEDNMNMLALLTGIYEWDVTPQLTNGGWATSETNPWLAQFLEDLVAVCQDSNFVAQEMLPAGWYGVFPLRRSGNVIRDDCGDMGTRTKRDIDRMNVLSGSSFGEPFRPTNGVGQGCSLSLGIVNAMVTLWMLVIQEQDPTCRAGAIIDDRNVRTNTCDQLKTVLTESAFFDELSGHGMNTSKTVVFSTSVKGCKQLSKLRVRGVPLKQSHGVKILGQQVGLLKATCRQMAHAVVREARIAVGRVPALSLPQDDAQRVLESAIIPTITSGAGLFTFPSLPFASFLSSSCCEGSLGHQARPSSSGVGLGAHNEGTPCGSLFQPVRVHTSKTSVGHSSECHGIREQCLSKFWITIISVKFLSIPGARMVLSSHLRTVMWYLDMEITSYLRIHRVGGAPVQWLEQQDGWWVAGLA